MMAAIGRTGRPNRAEMASSESCFTPPAFLAADNLKPYIGSDLQVASSTVGYRTLSGQPGLRPLTWLGIATTRKPTKLKRYAGPK